MAPFGQIFSMGAGPWMWVATLIVPLVVSPGAASSSSVG